MGVIIIKRYFRNGAKQGYAPSHCLFWMAMKGVESGHMRILIHLQYECVYYVSCLGQFSFYSSTTSIHSHCAFTYNA